MIYNCLAQTLADKPGGAIVYCARRKHTEDLSRFLNEKNILCEAFHAGRSEPDKRNIQDDFITGKIPVICATNAFGMGIDKKDIRLVIHADIPGSLENYLQEAGRAGRDMAPSDCILLYEQDDIENQFSLNAYSRLSIKDIKKILKVLRHRGAKTPEIVITPGEIMRLIGYDPVEAKNDARIRTAVSWLERKGFIRRSFNRTLFFSGTPTVKNLETAGETIRRLNLSATLEQVYLTILHFLFNAVPNTLISADDICAALGRIENLPEKYLDPRQVILVLSDMAKAGLIREGVMLSAFLKPRGRGSAVKTLEFFMDVEKQMLAQMEELAPDAWQSPDDANVFNLRRMSQQLKDTGFETVTPDAVEKILRSMAGDKGKHSGKSIKITGKKGADQLWVYVKFSWQDIRQRMTLRHHAARVALETLIAGLPEKLRSGQAEVLVQFFITDIMDAMKGDLFLSGLGDDAHALIEQCLLYLHDMKIITLQNGLAVFRQAMTLTLQPGAARRQYTKGDYEPLLHHFDQKNVQVHVMEKFARLGLDKIKTALGFVRDYFSSTYDSFINQYFPEEKAIIKTAMTAEAYQKIIQSLENPVQEAVVGAAPEKNILVLAGPGSGKTKTIVHRCAWLIKAKSANPSSILVLCFNHQAMLELKKRIRRLAGQRAHHVSTMTYHGFAMRLTGRSFLDVGFSAAVREERMPFDGIIDEAVDMLCGAREIPGIDPAAARGHFLAGFRYILVDEYQDIDQRQYRLISALTGRLAKDHTEKISIMAVGDDDQSIYGFRNANIAFIRQFQKDYDAETFFLTENYRSSHSVIQASDALIRRNQDRMKTDCPGIINRKRNMMVKKPKDMDPSALVQMVHLPDMASQGVFVAHTIARMLARDKGLRPEDIAVVSRTGIGFPPLVAARMALAKQGINFCYAIKTSSGFPILKIREIQAVIRFLENLKNARMRPCDLKTQAMAQFNRKNIWTDQIAQMLDAWCATTRDMEISVVYARDFVLETLLEERREHKTGNGVFLGTVHSVKGMEFPVVFILDGGWRPSDTEEERRLYYVGMTRAKKRLYVCHTEGSDNPHTRLLRDNPYVHADTASAGSIKGFSDNLTVSTLGMADIYLNYPALFPESHEIHRNLSDLETGDTVGLGQKNDRIYVYTGAGRKIARLSRQGADNWRPLLQNIVTARILGIVERREQDNDDKKFKKALTEAWEIPIVEILHQKT